MYSKLLSGSLSLKSEPGSEAQQSGQAHEWRQAKAQHSMLQRKNSVSHSYEIGLSHRSQTIAVKRAQTAQQQQNQPPLRTQPAVCLLCKQLPLAPHKIATSRKSPVWKDNWYRDLLSSGPRLMGSAHTWPTCRTHTTSGTIVYSLIHQRHNRVFLGQCHSCCGERAHV
jgi:hypothetical protein